MSRYPEECPAFEVVSTEYGTVCKAGDVVEGFIAERDGGLLTLSFYPVGDESVAIGCDEQWSALFSNGRGPNCTLYPLTRAAVDMLEAFEAMR